MTLANHGCSEPLGGGSSTRVKRTEDGHERKGTIPPCKFWRVGSLLRGQSEKALRHRKELSFGGWISWGKGVKKEGTATTVQNKPWTDSAFKQISEDPRRLTRERRHG